MQLFVRLCINVVISFILLGYLQCVEMDKKYLVSEAYDVAKNLFVEGKNNYDMLKNKSLDAIDTFLDLVYIMNNEMARALRSAIVKFYKIKYFHDFTNYVLSMEEMIEITDHCLIDPIEKLESIRTQFHYVVKNFEDVRNFDSVNKCHKELPDEVAAAHCILHQAVLFTVYQPTTAKGKSHRKYSSGPTRKLRTLSKVAYSFNETMQNSLVTIVEIKTRQHAQDMNESLFNVQKCLNDYVPKFFIQLLVDTYTDKCGYLKVVNASIADLIKDKWRTNETMFPMKWGPLVNLLKKKMTPHSETLQEPLFLTLLSANMTQQDIVKTLY